MLVARRCRTGVSREGWRKKLDRQGDGQGTEMVRWRDQETLPTGTTLGGLRSWANLMMRSWGKLDDKDPVLTKVHNDPAQE